MQAYWWQQSREPRERRLGAQHAGCQWQRQRLCHLQWNRWHSVQNCFCRLRNQTYRRHPWTQLNENRTFCCSKLLQWKILRSGSGSKFRKKPRSINICIYDISEENAPRHQCCGSGSVGSVRYCKKLASWIRIRKFWITDSGSDPDPHPIYKELMKFQKSSILYNFQRFTIYWTKCPGRNQIRIPKKNTYGYPSTTTCRVTFQARERRWRAWRYFIIFNYWTKCPDRNLIRPDP